jgi:CrcB protein
MSTWTTLLVAVGAAVGAPARYLLDAAITARVGTRFPWGTLVVNVLGSLVLGVLAGGAVDGGLLALAGTGFCGAFTTASTFTWEVLALGERGEVRRAAAYVVASVAVGVGAAALGFWVVHSG